VRILVFFTFALIFSSVAMLLTSARISRRTVGEFFEGSAKLELQQARRAYETGGVPKLAEYLAEVDSALKGKRYLIDANGSDLVSNMDRSEMRSSAAPNFIGPLKTKDGRFIIASDQRYSLLVVGPPPPVPPILFAPYFLTVLLLVAFLGWGLSVGIVAPLHSVANTVERFGKGDLSARIECDRKDEIGDVARSFNSMAGRIETLLGAERRLLQDVSHELRSPLARLSFAAELMKNAPDPEAAAARMRQEIEKLSRLVSALLEVTSAEGDPSTRTKDQIPIAFLMKDVLQDCVFESQAHRVRIEPLIQSSAILECDPELLRRAIENVLRNAIRYSPEGSSVAVEVEDCNGGVKISVRDFGPGVPDEMLERIFDPFFRVDQSRNGEAGGVGLGLSIAHRAVVLHHGSITAENVSPGLRLRIVLPAV
jgi:two-component system sensor histidine kinase CpxA